jgi:hypothetical protein
VCCWDSFTFLYVDDVCTSQKTRTSTVCCWDIFTFLYVDDVCTSQETRTSAVCCWDSFTFLYVDDVCTSQKTRTSTVCCWDIFTFLYVNVCTSQKTRTSTVCCWNSFTLLYVDDVCTSQETRTFTVCYGDATLLYSHDYEDSSVVCDTLLTGNALPASWGKPLLPSSVWKVLVVLGYTKKAADFMTRVSVTRILYRAVQHLVNCCSAGSTSSDM